jgi:hypothetical protein
MPSFKKTVSQSMISIVLSTTAEAIIWEYVAAMVVVVVVVVVEEY